MSESAGRVAGYFALWNTPSENLAERGAPPWRERIVPRAFTIANNAFLDAHHNEFSACAFCRDGTLLIGCDDTGAWLSATLAPSAHGYDIAAGLREFGTLQASFVMTNEIAHWDADGDERINVIDSATIVSVSVMAPNAACYPQTRIWLDDATPIDPLARTLQQKFKSRTTATAASPARSSPRSAVANQQRPTRPSQMAFFNLWGHSDSEWRDLMRATARNLSRTAGR